MYSAFGSKLQLMFGNTAFSVFISDIYIFTAHFIVIKLRWDKHLAEGYQIMKRTSLRLVDKH
jgi:hypothetical protein